VQKIFKMKYKKKILVQCKVVALFEQMPYNPAS